MVCVGLALVAYRIIALIDTRDEQTKRKIATKAIFAI
jgi:hypothetical protein